MSGEISKLLNAVGPSNAPILKVNQGKLTKFFLRARQKQQDGLYVYSKKEKENRLNYSRWRAELVLGSFDNVILMRIYLLEQQRDLDRSNPEETSSPSLQTFLNVKHVVF